MNWSPTIAYVAIILVTGAAARFDLKTGRIPNRLTYPAILGGIAYWAIALALSDGDQTAVDGALRAGWGLLAALIPLTALYFIGGLGYGDVKLMTAVGSLSASPMMVLHTLIFALIVGFFMALFTIFRKRIVKYTLLRVVNAAFSLARKQKPDLDDENGATIPFAVCIAMGAAVAGTQHLLGVDLVISG